MKYPSFESRMPREQATKALERVCARLDACATVEMNEHAIPGVDTPTGPITAIRLWVAGSYARGALTCGDLDLVMEVNQPLVSGSYLKRMLLGNPQRVSLYTGNPKKNTSFGEFAEAVLVWEAGKDWRAALAGIQQDASVSRFDRPTDLIPFRREQVKGDLTWAETMVDRHARKELTWRFVPLEEVADQIEAEPQPDETRGLYRLAKVSRAGTDVRKLLPYVLAFVRRFGPADGWWSMDSTTLMTYGRTRFILAGPPALDELMDPGISQVVVMAHLNTRGPNGFWVIERGPNHPLMSAFDGCNAWFIADEHGAPTFVQCSEGTASTHGHYVTALDIFQSRAEADQYVKEWNQDDPPEPDEAREVKHVQGAALRDLLMRCDLLIGGLSETVFSKIGLDRAQHAGYQFATLTRRTVEELAALFRQPAESD